MGLWDFVKSTGKTIFNTIKKPISGLWSGIKSVDSLVSNPIAETAIAIAQPELSPFIAGYDIAKWGLQKTGLGDILDDALN